MCVCADIKSRITIDKDKERNAKRMNNMELQEKIANKFGLSKAMSLKIMRFVAEEIKDAVAAGESVKVAGFGTFKRASVAERETVSPYGGKVSTPAHNRAKFVPAKDFKSRVW